MATETILRMPQVLARIGLSRASVYARIADGSFPAPLAIGSKARGWLDSEITSWLESRIEKRNAAQAARAARSNNALASTTGCRLMKAGFDGAPRSGVDSKWRRLTLDVSDV